MPIPNAYELYQGLQDVGVPVKLIVYKGFGHGLNKPKAARAAQEHNLEWFGKYVWGEGTPTTSASAANLQCAVRLTGRTPERSRRPRRARRQFSGVVVVVFVATVPGTRQPP